MPDTGVNEQPKLLNITEAAKYVGIGRQPMETAFNSGQVPWVRIGGRRVVSTEVLDKLLSEAGTFGTGTQEQSDE